MAEFERSVEQREALKAEIQQHALVPVRHLEAEATALREKGEKLAQ